MISLGERYRSVGAVAYELDDHRHSVHEERVLLAIEIEPLKSRSRWFGLAAQDELTADIRRDLIGGLPRTIQVTTGHVRVG